MKFYKELQIHCQKTDRKYSQSQEEHCHNSVFLKRATDAEYGKGDHEDFVTGNNDGVHFVILEDKNVERPVKLDHVTYCFPFPQPFLLFLEAIPGVKKFEISFRITHDEKQISLNEGQDKSNPDGWAVLTGQH